MGSAGAPMTIDLRSDTVTEPSLAMRTAMAQAAVGDDGYGDDPTIAELERYAATLFGKEAALFVPTGVMGNLISVLTHCRERGSEVILGNKSHLCYYEQGGLSTLGSVHSRQLPNAADGTIALDDIRDAIRADGKSCCESPLRDLIVLTRIPLRSALSAHQAHLPREHAKPLRRARPSARLHG